jgi:hypothetical protein
MQSQVAVAAQRDQVLLRIIPGLTAKFLVMNLEVLQAPAGRRTDISTHPFAGLLDKAARTIRDPVAGVVASVEFDS